LLPVQLLHQQNSSQHGMTKRAFVPGAADGGEH